MILCHQEWFMHNLNSKSMKHQLVVKIFIVLEDITYQHRLNLNNEVKAQDEIMDQKLKLGGPRVLIPKCVNLNWTFTMSFTY
jgi:hypothetical protein